MKNEEIMNSARRRISGFEENIVSSGMIDEIKRMLKIEFSGQVQVQSIYFSHKKKI